jgi:hypothetical protein
MTEQPGEKDRRSRRIALLKGIIGGCSIILIPFAIIAGAVLWRAAWYFE